MEIKKIIRAFKVSMNAKNLSGEQGEQGSGLFVKSPDVFQLTYKTGSKNHQFLHKFKPMALLNMAVNYTCAGKYATYDNTAPVHMKMNLSFQELNPIYSEDYETEEGNWLILSSCDYMLSDYNKGYSTRKHLINNGYPFSHNHYRYIPYKMIAAMDAWEKLNSEGVLTMAQLGDLYAYLGKAHVKRG